MNWPLPEPPPEAKLAAPLIVTATMGAADFSWADELRRRHYPPERNLVPAHISLFRHLPPSIAGELKAALAEAAKLRRPTARITSVTSLEQGAAIMVESPELAEIRAQLAERFTGLLTAMDLAAPRFHITVQNKVDAAVARRTVQALELSVEPRPIIIHGLACWRYLGGSWEQVSAHSFRG